MVISSPLGMNLKQYSMMRLTSYNVEYQDHFDFLVTPTDSSSVPAILLIAQIFWFLLSYLAALIFWFLLSHLTALSFSFLLFHLTALVF
jgi:hypothetical protein